MEPVQAAFPQMNRRYTLHAKLGQGGMGIVYRAMDRLTREIVALKQVSVPAAELQFATTSNDPTLALALEFRTLAGLRHPHIVAVLDYGFDAARRPYYTMQLLEGAQSLTDYAQGLDEPGKVRLIVEMLQALVYLHRRGVIHRDLKPANVLVTQGGSVKVMDFGLAFQQEASVQLGTGMAGTLQYMAPELFSEAPASVASDLYAVGVIIHEIFVGHPPFAAKNLPTLITSILTHDPDLTALPPALRPLVGQLLAKTPDERYARAEDVIEPLCVATRASLPVESSLLRESFLQASAFVGREAEMTTLKEALEAAFVGQGSVWLVDGESGVGKSRLLDELRARALLRGTLVLRGQAVAEAGLPYQLWRDIIRRLVLETDLSDLEAGIFKPLVADIAALLEREVADVVELPGAAGQQRLILTLMDVLKRQMQPLVLLLEDLHWADESLAPLRQMLQVCEQLPNLLVIGTYRDDEHPTLPDNLAGAHILKLPRLDETAIAQLAQSMLGETGAQPGVVDLLLRETEGNVFFMVETVRALAEDAGTLTAIGHITLPQAIFAGGVQRFVQRRLSRLPNVWQPLLQRAAVAGRTLDLAVMGHLSEGADLEEFLAAGLNASVFEVFDERWRFSHDKLREGVLAALSEDNHRTLNRAVALALEASYPDDANYYEGLMEHWRMAGNIERELYYLVPLTRQLTKIRADYERALHLAAHGLELLDERDWHRATLLTLSSEAYERKGRIDEAILAAEQALALAREMNDQESAAESLSRLGMSVWYKGDYTAAQAYQMQSLALFQEIGHKEGIAKSLFQLAAYASDDGHSAEARDYVGQSLTLFQDIGDKQGLALSFIGLGLSAWLQGDYRTVQDHFEQGLALRQAIGDKRGVAASLNHLGMITDLQGDYTAALNYCQQSLTLRHEIGDPEGIAVSLYGLSVVSLSQGNITEARNYCEQSLALRRSTGHKHGLAESLNGMGNVEWFEGNFAISHMYHQQSLELRRKSNNKPEVVQSLYNLGDVEWSQRNFEAAYDFYQQSLVLARKIGNKQYIAYSLTGIAELELDKIPTDVGGLLREALSLRLDMGATRSLLFILSVFARWHIRVSRAVDAAAIAGLLEAHPRTDAYTRIKETVTLKQELQAALPADELTTALEQGKTLDLETTVRHLLAQSW